MENEIRRLSFVDNSRYIPNSPLRFFINVEKLDNNNEEYRLKGLEMGMGEPDIPSLSDLISMLHSRSVFDAGIIELRDNGSIFFRIMLKAYDITCVTNPQHSNIQITKCVPASSGMKLRFIEHPRKTISDGGYGVVVKLNNYGNYPPQMPNPRAVSYADKLVGAKDGAMPADDYSELYSYLKSDEKIYRAEKTEEEDISYFRRNYLDVMSKYSEFSYQIEQNNALGANGTVYTDAKSIRVIGDSNRKMVYEFTCPDLDSEEFAAGDEVVIELSGSEIIFGSIRDVKDAEGDAKCLTISFKNQFDETRLPRTGEINKKANNTQKNVRDRVVKQFEKRDVTAQYMLKTFNSYDMYSEGMDETIDVTPIFDNMDREGKLSNPSQREAIRKGIQTRDIALVLGPPGTGKTTVIVEWILYYISRHKKILISSKNNKAVDNVFERVARFREREEYKDLQLIRVGNSDKIQENVRPFLPNNQYKEIENGIVPNIEKTLAAADASLAAIDSAMERADEVRERTDNYFDICETLEERYDGYAAAITEAYRSYTAAAETKALYEKYSDSTAMLRIYLEENAKKNVFIRLLHILATRRALKQYEKGKLAVSELENKYARQTAGYFAAIERVKAFKNDRDFQDMKNQYRVWKRRVESYVSEGRADLSVTIPMHIPGIEGYRFDNNRSSLEAYAGRLSALRKNVEDIKAVIEEWSQNVHDKSNDVLTKILIDRAQVVGATCIGINNNRSFQDIDFDVAILDEAGQIQIHDAFVPMSRARKTLMLGDHKQIPPFIDDGMTDMCIANGVTEELLEKSLFEYIYTKRGLSGNTVMLDTQFRMPEEVADILSYQFYGGKYKSADSKKKLETLCPGLFKKTLVLVDTVDGGNRRYHEQSGKSVMNRYEAEVVVSVLRGIRDKLEDAGGDGIELGVIVPYKPQVTLLCEEISKAFPSLAGHAGEMVATLDSFQGQERDMIIYSFTRRPRGSKSIGFLDELRRLNVALSRCKKQMVIVGDFEFLTTCRDTTEEEEELLKDEAAGYSLDEIGGGDDYSDFFEDDDEDDETLTDDEKILEHNTALTRTQTRFVEFMEYLVKEVKAGKGQYMKSKELVKY